MSAFAVSLLALACCGVIIVGGALLGMYGAERRRTLPEKSPATPSDRRRAGHPVAEPVARPPGARGADVPRVPSS